MANGYYGIQTAGAAMSGMNAAYNRNVMKLANLQMYERSEMRRDEATAFSRGQSRVNASLKMMNTTLNLDSQMSGLLSQLQGLDLEGKAGKQRATAIYGNIVSLQNQKTRMNTLVAENPNMFAPGSGGMSTPAATPATPTPAVPESGQPIQPTASAIDTAPSPTITQIGDTTEMAKSRERVTVAGQPKYFDPKTGLYHNVSKKGYISDVGDVLQEDIGINEATYLEKAKPTLDKGGSDIVKLGSRLQSKDIKNQDELTELVRQSISPMNTMLQRIHEPWAAVGKLPSKMVGHNLTSLKAKVANSKLKTETKQALSEAITATMNAGELEGDVGSFGMNLDKDALTEIHASIEKAKPKITAKIDGVLRALVGSVTALPIHIGREIGGLFTGTEPTMSGTNKKMQDWAKSRMTPEQKAGMVEETYKGVMQDLEQSDTFQETIYDSAAALINSGAQFVDANGEQLTGSALVNKAQEVARTKYTEELLNAINTHINDKYPTYDAGKKPLLDSIGTGIKKAGGAVISSFRGLSGPMGTRPN